MKRVLEKVSWKTRRVNLKFYLFNLDLHDHNGSWGFCIDEWDILFIRRVLFLAYEDLCEKKIWGNNLSTIDKINLSILEKLFK